MKVKWKNPVWQLWLRRGLLIGLILIAILLWLSEEKISFKPKEQPVPSPMPANVLSDRKIRETAYERDLSALQALLKSEAADESTQEQAAQMLTALIGEHQNEIRLEAALVEAGFENTVVLIQNSAATVMLPESELNETVSAQILELCVVHAGVDAKNVRVMGLN